MLKNKKNMKARQRAKQSPAAYHFQDSTQTLSQCIFKPRFTVLRTRNLPFPIKWREKYRFVKSWITVLRAIFYACKTVKCAGSGSM